MANGDEETQCAPPIILAPNKTRQRKLMANSKAFFPENAFEYFVSL